MSGFEPFFLIAHGPGRDMPFVRPIATYGIDMRLVPMRHVRDAFTPSRRVTVAPFRGQPRKDRG
jgi:hypothetical protein